MRKIGMAAVAAGLALALAATGAAAAPRSSGMTDSFLPENTMRIPVRAESAGKGLTEAQFNQVLDKIEGIYAPIIAGLGGKLEIERRWTDDTVNAYAQRLGDVYKVSMFGGLARHEAVTQDGFALVVCHELGHHLGGAPKKGARWASNEGQADYYGNLKCLRRVFSSGTGMFTRAAANDEVARKACAESFSSASERALCLRESMAGVSLGTLLNILGGGTVPPQFDTPDASVASQTDDNHPAAQCRLDTYFQAALCARPWTETMSDTDPNAGSCTRSQGFSVGLRPVCWYKPTPGELSAEPRVAESKPVSKTPVLASLNENAFSGL